MSSRGRFATPADFPQHDGTPYRGLHVRRESLGFVHRLQRPFSVAPCQTLTLRLRFFAVSQATARAATKRIARALGRRGEEGQRRRRGDTRGHAHRSARRGRMTTCSARSRHWRKRGHEERTTPCRKQVSFLNDAKSSLGDAKSSLSDAKSSLGDAESLLGDAKSSLGDAKSSLGER